MNKTTQAGIDVSAQILDVETGRCDGPQEKAQFDNTASGHRQLIKWLTKRGRSVRVVLEATGSYSLDVALALHAAKRVEVMMVNPRAARKFAEACMQRSSTDACMAHILREYAQRMDFVGWQPPPAEVNDLRAVARRVAALSTERTRELNRLHAAKATAQSPAVLLNDIEVNIRHLQRRIEALNGQALKLIAAYPWLQRAYDHLNTICGVGTTSAIQLLGELLVLPRDMDVRQWVAHAGLDVRHFRSGSSVEKKPRISKVGNAHIRRVLFLPAMVAVRHQPHVTAFYQQLLAAGKKPLQAIVAVMRKLLHSIYGMLKTDTDFDGAKFRALPHVA